MKNKKQFFSILLSVLICVFVFTAIVYATTTIGNDVTVGGILTVSGVTTSSSFAGDLDIEGDVNIGNGDLYVDMSSGNVGIGTTNPASIFSLSKTFTENAPSTGDYKSYYGQRNNFSVEPSGDSTNGSYYGAYNSIAVPSSNTNDINAIYGANYTISLQGTGDISSADNVFSISNIATTDNIKTLWASGTNYGNVSGFFYGLQANIDNWAYDDTMVGDINTLKAGRFRIQNYGLNALSYVANIDDATAVFANIDQGNYEPSLGATIGTATGFKYDLTNYLGGSITNSYGLYLSAPSNSGVITNHYGIYLANQTVAGTTNNYAIYSVGGQNYLAGNVGIGDTSPAYTLSVDGTASVSGTMYVKDVYFSGVVSASDTGGVIVGEGAKITAGTASASGACGTAGSMYIRTGQTDVDTVINICGSDSAWNPTDL